MHHNVAQASSLLPSRDRPVNRIASDTANLIDIQTVSVEGYHNIFQEESGRTALDAWPMLSALFMKNQALAPGAKESARPTWSGQTIVAVTGTKGGVGRTSCAANLAVALARAGIGAIALDLDPQNALGAHFGLEADGRTGVAHAALSGDSWHTHLRPVGPHAPFPAGSAELQVLSFGQLDNAQERAFQQHLGSCGDWVHAGLASLDGSRARVVVIDLPAHPSDIMRQVLAEAHVTITVMLADAASCLCEERARAAVPDLCLRGPGAVRSIYLLNQIDHSRRLQHDVARFLQQRLAGHELVFVHQDQAVPEALACGATVVASKHQAQAARDFTDIAAKLVFSIQPNSGEWALPAIDDGVHR
ncbi:cellulose biosynthesis protein BcsQ [Xylophilus ampelinus]|uniref:Cellulose synthase operon protein YhjQ n=1 Tax=Xylophilus ampelinus TaxID=54067 RepID=A0A318SM32_9BURK|nr:cellulose biosynthesis protein BcsQ [Xylophilus ampelinus]MCS4510085.1 cellulose biosynthesis protein BcsQ [Xylophilus ampelinus]PYE78232.1 cellulose synthase operon protein YhjQ [Xylophilus ampelinus]